MIQLSPLLRARVARQCVVAGMLLIAHTGVARAQAAAGLDPKKAIGQYILESWQVEQGLPQNSVLFITQTRDGYLWLGTQGGLARFDGHSFTAFNPATTPAIKDQDVRGLIVDRNGDLWLSTALGGLNRLHNGRFSEYPGAVSASGAPPLYQDRSGVMWTGTNKGLSALREGAFRVSAGINARTRAMGETPNGLLIVGADSGLFILREGRLERWQPFGVSIREPVWSIHNDRAGSAWIGTTDHLYRIDATRVDVFTTKDGLPEGEIRAILETRNGQLWVGSNESGLARLRDGRFEHFTTKDGLTDDGIESLFEDHEGSLWVGTTNGGLNRLREPMLTLYTQRDGLTTQDLWSVWGESERRMWIGTNGGGLFRFEGGKFTATTKDNGGIPDNTVTATLRASNGDLWIGTHRGAARLHNGRWEDASKLPGVPTGRIYSFLEDSTGAIWIGGAAGDLYRWKDGRAESFARQLALPPARIWSMLQDRRGNLWIATLGGGLVRYRNGAFTKFGLQEGLAHLGLESIYLDGDDLVMGTQFGRFFILRSGSDRVIELPSSGQLGMKDVYQITPDNSGYFWFSSNEGLTRVSRRDLFEGVPGKIVVRHFDRFDGMPRNAEMDASGLNAGFKDSAGRLWYPSNKGLVMVDPDRLPINTMPPPVHIERLLIDGREIHSDSTLTLPPSDGELEIHYTATSLLVPSRVAFRYKLEGYDKDWVDAGDRRVAYYTHVPGGDYRFRVIAANNDGVWNEVGAELAFKMKPHFYETVLFKLLCGLALIAAAAAAVRLRMRQVHQNAAALTKLVDERTAELRTSEERYRGLFEANPQPVWVYDVETLAFLAVNQAAVDHYGYSRDEFLAMKVSDVRCADDVGHTAEHAVSGEWSGAMMRRDCKRDGTVIEVEVAAHDIMFAGRRASLSVISDVTARRDLEERLRQAQKMEAVGQLAGGIAHDLNNVLTAVMAHVDLAVTAIPADSEIITDLVQAQSAAHRGATMIRKLLGFGRRTRLVLKPLDLSHLVGELAGTIRRVLPTTLEVVVNTPESLPPVAADAGAVQQMLLNLATNARDAMPNGGQLCITVRPVVLDKEHHSTHGWGTPGRYVALDVTDTGVGMDAATLARIFEPYFSTKAEGHGSGLGMAMVYGLISQHMGYVHVRSDANIGTTVTLYFPVSSTPIAAPPPEARSVLPVNETILVVEDEDAVRTAAERALKRSGYRVLTASNGTEGLEVWRANADTIDLVLSDAIMPGMSGQALFAAIREERDGVRVMLTSGYSGEEVRASIPLEADVPFLSKPWTVKELLDGVREVLSPVGSA